MWLDLLPLELTHRIATALHHHEDLTKQHLLHLAETTPRQKSAILTALARCYTVDLSTPTPIAARWLTLFRNDVQKLDAANATYVDLSTYDLLMPLLSSPSLQVAVVDDSAPLLRAAARARALRDITIVVCEPNEEALKKLLEDTTADAVTLTCVNEGHGCGFAEIAHELPEWCARFGVVKLNCGCFEQDDSALWELIPRMSTLTEVAAMHEPPQESVGDLARLQSVGVDCTAGFDAARQLGRVVTSVTWDWPLAYYGDISCLADCTRLAQMSCKIFEGDDRWFREAFGDVCPLESLSVLWVEKEQSTQAVGGLLTNRMYPRATGGVIRDLVLKTTRLAKLHLQEVRMELGDVLAMLEHAGANLKDFATSISGQGEGECERLCAILDCVVVNNCNLEMLGVSELGYLPCQKCEGQKVRRMTEVPAGLESGLERKGHELKKRLMCVRRKVAKLQIGLLWSFAEDLCALGGEGGRG